MTAVGGSIESVEMDGRLFPVPADAEANITLGGYSNEVEPNGDGATARLIKTFESPGFDGLAVEIDHDRGDLEFLQGLRNRKDFFPLSVTLAGGETYQGRGQIVGELQANTKSASAPLSLKGVGTFTQQ